MSHSLTQCEDGPLEVEVVLFATTLGASATTSAGEALSRLAQLGLTATFAARAMGAAHAETLASYAQADCVRAVLHRLGPTEVFAGRTYDRRTQSYEGDWIDLRSFAADLGTPSAGLVLQGLYLASVLSDLAPVTPIRLDNVGSSKAARLAFGKPEALLDALGRLRPRPAFGRADREHAVRDALARRLRDDAAAAVPNARMRHLSIEQALYELDKPMRGPLADSDLWAMERQLAANEPRGVMERLQAYVRAYGAETAGTRYLRAHLSLVDGSAPPRRVAELLEDEERTERPFDFQELLKARAWFAAGALPYARHFARVLAEDPNVSPDVRRRAYEVVQAVDERGAGGEAPVPVPAMNERPAFLDRGSSRPSAAPRPSFRVPEAPHTAARASLGAPRPSTPAPRHSFGAPRPSNPAPAFGSPLQLLQSNAPRSALESYVESDNDNPSLTIPSAARRPPEDIVIPIEVEQMTVPPPRAWQGDVAPSPPRRRYVPEELESLSDPTAQVSIRSVSTDFARALGREYRETYGVRLRTDAQTVEWMQRHLVARWGDAGQASPEREMDVRRHGALLSEILARTLNAEWVDVAPAEIGSWAMFVPPRTRTWPFGRVHRFVNLGHRAKDLVSYYLRLVDRSREER